MAHVFVLGSLAESLINFRGPLLKEMVRRGHRVTAAAPNASPDVRQQLTDIGVEYRSVPIERTGLNPFADFSCIISLFRLMREVRPDVFLGYTIKPVIYGSLAARLARIPAIYTMVEGIGYAFMATGTKGALIRLLACTLYRACLRFSRRVIFLNPDDIELFLDKNLIAERKRVVQINGTGIDLTHYASAPLPKQVTFLLIARLLVSKGVREYAEAAALIKKSHPNAKFRLAGWIDEGLDAISEVELEEWQRAGTIEFVGRLADVRPTIADSAVYVLPSYREGIPRTVLEAMAMGRPIIATDVPGCRETVKDGHNGILVPARDPQALATAMVRFLTEPQLVPEMGARSSIMVAERFEISQVNQSILETLELA